MTGLFAGGGILARGDDTTIAYRKLDGKGPGIVFLHGFRSDMTGAKAVAVEAWCKAHGRAFVRYDAFGHGESSGKFEDGTIGRWADDAIAVLDQLTVGRQILVGSSMGGWLMLLAALARPDRIAGLLGLAAAPDFTEDSIWAQATDDQKDILARNGKIDIPDCSGGPSYPITRRLIEEGRDRLLLRNPIRLACPVRLIHGQRDADVPWQTALRLAERLGGDDIEVVLVKSAGHRLSEPADLERMTTVLGSLIESVERSDSHKDEIPAP